MKDDSYVIVSACLLGKNCRYNGDNSINQNLIKKLKKNNIISICSEQLGGLPTPRAACNISSGSGIDVLRGESKIIGIDGNNYTEKFLFGAKKAIELIRNKNISEAYLKQNSPSCGYGQIYSSDGTKIISGNGVFAELLCQLNIKINPIL